MTDTAPQPYRVLARKYRPQRFADLIGQEAMVQTLGNAIRRDRIAHAFLMTGVRGVGKTSTARLIAKALNCVGPDGQGGPTIDPCGVCEPCQAIAEGRHIDVIEMDAASNTGVDDVREIIEAVRYAAVSARFKIYIIDEVHMLSRNAFNALLKTLEEPPAHVKFLFATTEVHKLPVTVLSRCQRFDLRRIPADRLADHFAYVVGEEGVEAEPEALALIARAAEGSARDGLSILDQAIAHGIDKVTADQVREMLGLADRNAIRDLFGIVLEANAEGALAGLRNQYDLGVEPTNVLRGLLEIVHAVTRAKSSPQTDPAQSTEERAAYDQWAARLGFAALHRLWQLLLKGLQEVMTAPLPYEAAEMALLRVIHASTMPDPGEWMRRAAAGEFGVAASGASSPASASAAPSASASASAPAMTAPAADGPTSYLALVELLESHGKMIIGDKLRREYGLVRFAPPELVLHGKPRAAERDFLASVTSALRAITGTAWNISESDLPAEPTLAEQAQMAEEAARLAILADPMVAAALGTFPGSELIDQHPLKMRSA